MNVKNRRRFWTALTLAIFGAGFQIAMADALQVGQTVHLFDYVQNIKLAAGDATVYCAPPKTEIGVLAVASDMTVTFDIEELGKADVTAFSKTCHAMTQGGIYTVAASELTNTKIQSQGLVTGFLAVPYKFHVNDHASTVGTTIGGYVGYSFAQFGRFSVTPVLGGGVALISTQAAQATSSGTTPASTSSSTSSQTNAGFSLAGGFIGTIGSSNTQIGIVFGSDWLGHKANYPYEGKGWLAFEVGYNFSTSTK
jgi:hypothetical protein